MALRTAQKRLEGLGWIGVLALGLVAACAPVPDPGAGTTTTVGQPGSLDFGYEAPPKNVLFNECDVLGTAGNDTLYSQGNVDTVCGFGGNDQIIVTHDQVTVVGGSGADTIRVEGVSAAFVYPGPGDDSVSMKGVSGSGVVRDGSVRIKAGPTYFVYSDNGLGDDQITFDDVSGYALRAGLGRDRVEISGSRAGSAFGGDGDDVMRYTGVQPGRMLGEAGDDILIANAFARFGSFEGGLGNDFMVTMNGFTDNVYANTANVSVGGAVGPCSVTTGFPYPTQVGSYSVGCGIPFVGELTITVGTDNSVSAGGSFLEGVFQVSLGSLSNLIDRSELPSADVCICDPPVYTAGGLQVWGDYWS